MERSIDREKVIRLLQEMAEYFRECRSNASFASKAENHFWELQNASNEAVAMLKEQEHGETFIVIDSKTGEEADTYNIALHEDWAKHLCYCDIDGWAIEDDGTLMLVDDCGRVAYADRERFKVVWDD